MNVTELERKMIAKIALNEFTYVNGEYPETLADIYWVWANMVIETSADKGVFSSLVKKNIAKHDGGTGRDACVSLTQEGLDLFKTFKEYK